MTTISFIFLNCYYCNITMYLGYEEFMLCLTTKNITCYQCSLQQLHRFPHSPSQKKPLFKPFAFLNAISKFFSLRIAEEGSSLLKETCRFLVKVEPVEENYPPFYQPPTVFSTGDLINCLESHAFKKNPPLLNPAPVLLLLLCLASVVRAFVYSNLDISKLIAAR